MVAQPNLNAPPRSFHRGATYNPPMPEAKPEAQQDYAAQLAAPFDPEVVEFRIDGRPREYQGKWIARVVAYVDARAVQDRLDQVVGPDTWSFSVQMVTGATFAAIGTLTIGGISKSDAGEDETVKGAVSDALKRSAVQWQIGRYLYRLGAMFAEVVKKGDTWQMAKDELPKLRAKLPR